MRGHYEEVSVAISVGTKGGKRRKEEVLGEDSILEKWKDGSYTGKVKGKRDNQSKERTVRRGEAYESVVGRFLRKVETKKREEAS